MTLEYFISATVAICAFLYILTAAGYAYRGQWGWAVVYSSYAMANVGLIIAGLEALKHT